MLNLQDLFLSTSGNGLEKTTESTNKDQAFDILSHKTVNNSEVTKMNNNSTMTGQTMDKSETTKNNPAADSSTTTPDIHNKALSFKDEEFWKPKTTTNYDDLPTEETMMETAIPHTVDYLLEPSKLILADIIRYLEENKISYVKSLEETKGNQYFLYEGNYYILDDEVSNVIHTIILKTSSMQTLHKTILKDKPRLLALSKELNNLLFTNEIVQKVSHNIVRKLITRTFSIHLAGTIIHEGTVKLPVVNVAATLGALLFDAFMYQYCLYKPEHETKKVDNKVFASVIEHEVLLSRMLKSSSLY